MSATLAAPAQASRRDNPRVLIVGAGFGGISAAIELRNHGFSDVRILEQAADLGGTWYFNSYPGAACDVPSHLYSFSFAQRRDWSRLCSPQEEIHSYLREVAEREGVDRLIELNKAVESCTWEQSSCSWTVRTAQGERYEADAIVLATGQLHKPAVPPIDGAESFAGHSFHSSQWDHDYPLAGKRVAVIGTGASAVQFVPEIAGEAEHLTVFQRTGNWFLPRDNRCYPALVKLAIERVPGLQSFRRWFFFEYGELLTLAIRHPATFGRFLGARSRAHMRSQLPDPELRRKVWPDYTFGCKRVLFSSDFLTTLARPNVELVTESIARFVPEGILTADGVLHAADCVIWATGFRTTEFMVPMQVHGAGGLELADSWAQGPHAHLGITVPGFPNMFLMYGPNTNTSGGSIIFYEEAQARYLRQGLQQMRARGAGAIEVRPEVEAASDRALQAHFDGTAWTQCSSWYRNEQGRIVANWPGYMREYSERTRTLDGREYLFLPLPAAHAEREPAVSSSGAALADA